MIVTANQLEQSLTELYSREQEYGKALDDDADAEHAYKMKYSQEFLSSDGSNADKCKADAIVKSADELKRHLKAKAIKDFTYEKLRDSQSAMSARQSLLTASVKSDLSYANDKRVT